VSVTRFLDSVIRYWWLWFLPVIATGVMAAAIINTRTPQYDVQMTLWVERLTYLDPSSAYSWVSPAQAQVDIFRQLLGSRAFIVKVAEKTALAPHTTSETGQDYLEEQFNKRLWIGTRGSQLVEITYRTTDPAIGPAVLEALLEVATQYTTASTREQAKIATQFYSALLPQREKDYLESSAALRDYLAQRGGAPEPQLGERSLEQLELTELRRREELARKRYEDTIQILDSVRLQASALETAQQRGFRVVDAPYVPKSSVSLRRELVLPVAMTFGATAAIALGIPLLLTVLDRSLRTPAQVLAAFELPTLGRVPWQGRLRRLAATRRGAGRSMALQSLLDGR
jgi:uncharacterized protein involved in exopolysaccharide biosynthesis